MTRGTALVANVGHVARLTGQAGLAALETDGELTVPQLLVTASDAIYDRLEVDGVDPSALTNAERYERAVAFTFLALVAPRLRAGNETPQEATDRYTALADRFYEAVKPRASTSTAEKTLGAVPAVWNPGQDGPELDYWRNAP